MFAEDIGLLPQDLFTRLLDECRKGASSYDLIGGLFRQMNEPKPARAGRYAGVDYFNGGLFESIVPPDFDAPFHHPNLGLSQHREFLKCAFRFRIRRQQLAQPF